MTSSPLITPATHLLLSRLHHFCHPLTMNVASRNNEKSRLPCEAFAKGGCTRGKACGLDHAYNLDPARRSDRAEGTEEYEVPNEPGTACTRCVEQLRECDKLARGGIEDPCSEYRHFGGPGCQCVLARSLTYNDQAWGQMMLRSASGFDLAPRKSKDAILGKKTDKKTGKVTGKP
ncbi:hypothetical protein K491DRAFT_250524 [Lophiostoma macrostomum CBS 122681]|uniref:C3H1-type domain-containing protein n=1 Tax=Lophiostoma macrostomum CBS 122681 TaxID=1314788 RepID=A0A6A6SP22_9PLEO|nr:hypothetical protein K491DRAFT_250524 [Lophiostoma macrostomum CBS 122681]